MLLVFVSAFCFIEYSSKLDATLNKIVATAASQSDPQPVTRSKALESWGKDHDIPDRRMLEIYYLGVFLSAELSFVLMALREYGYSELNIPERAVLLSYGRVDRPIEERSEQRDSKLSENVP